MSDAIVVRETETSKTHATLANLDKARLALAEARTLPDVKRIRNMAEAARVYAKAAHLSKEALDYAAEIKLLAERKAGEILAKLDRGKPGPRLAASVAGNSEYRSALDDTNTPERTAQHWQEVAAVPADVVATYLKETKKSDAPVTTSGVLKQFRKSQRLATEKEPKVLGFDDRFRQVYSLTARLYDELPVDVRNAEVKLIAKKLVESLVVEGGD